MIRAFLAVELSEKLQAELATVQEELKRTIELEMKRGIRISWARPAALWEAALEEVAREARARI